MTEVPPEPDVAVNIGGFGDVDMHTGPTLAAMNGLARAASEFTSAWQGHKAAIEAEEAAVGGHRVLGDLLSAAFRAHYNAVAPQLVQGGDAVATTFESYATGGRAAVVTYLEIDGHEVPAVLRGAAGTG